MAQRRDAASVDNSIQAVDVAVASSPRLWLHRRSRAGKPSWGGLVVRALPILLLTTACSIGTDDVGVVPVTIRTLPPVDVEAELAGLDSDPVARAELISALQATGRAYAYETTVMFDDSVMMMVTGTVAGTAEQLRVARGGSVVEYLRSADGHWVLGPGDRRLPVDRIAAGTAPLDGLVETTALVVGHDLLDSSILEAVYAGGAVGVPEVDEVAVRLTIRNGLVSRVRYEVPVEGVTAQVVTVISSSQDERYGAGRDVRAAE
ncbi:MAG: hypothetical protein QNJ88_10935 [Acidimicrobiia bacterium]|nr:hypothetical protein [Acidimicrobiia bacterium]